MNQMKKINELAMKSVLQHAVIRELKEIHENHRAELGGLLSKGMRIPAVLGDDTIGTVTMTNPSPTAHVSDIHQVMAWAAEHMPEAITPRILDMDKAVEFLAEHAPELVTVDVPPHHRKTICRRAEAGEDIPGVQVSKSSSVMQIRSQEAKPFAKRAIQRALDKEIEAASKKEIEQ